MSTVKPPVAAPIAIAAPVHPRTIPIPSAANGIVRSRYARRTTALRRVGAASRGKVVRTGFGRHAPGIRSRARAHGADIAVSGIPVAAYEQAVREYRSMTPSARNAAAIARASAMGALTAPDESQLLMSPFGWHLTEFVLLSGPDSPLAGMRRPMHIAVYGGGLHSDSSLLAARLNRLGYRDHTQYGSVQLEAAERSLFGERMGTSYEPRELLALFLAGPRPGSVHVFDIDGSVGEDLRNPSFVYLDAARAYYANPPLKMEYVDRYWRFLAAGRDPERTFHGAGDTGYPIVSYRFDFTREEMAKLAFHEVDLATDRADAGVRFGLSVWFGSWYFLEPHLMQLAFAKIVRNAAMGGYVLTDLPRHHELAQAMGLEFVNSIVSELLRNGRTLTHLYQKVRDTDGTSQMAEIGIVRSTEAKR